MELEPARALYGTCSDCGQMVRNTPLDWHGHVCNASGLAARGHRHVFQTVGFKDKVRPGGSGNRRVPESVLTCELIALETDLARWNEFAEFEACRS